MIKISVLLAWFVAFSLPAFPADANAQESTTVDALIDNTEEIEIELFDQQVTDLGRGMTQLFLVEKDKRIHIAGEAKTISLPKGLSNDSLAYFRIYFVGRCGEVDKGVIVLVADFDTENPRFFVDQNNNLDFTDDEQESVDSDEEGRIQLTLHGDKPDAKFAIELMPFRGDKTMTAEKREMYRQMFEGLRDYMGGEFADAKYWFYNRRLNTRTNSVEIDGEKVLIGLHDYDCDGHFSGERDRLIVGSYGAKNISYALADGAVNLNPGEVFLVGESPYRFLEASGDGSRIRIRRSKEMPSRLFVGSKVPEIELKSFMGNTAKLSSLIQPDKLLVLDFWGHWCGPCVAAIPATVEFSDKWKDKVTFVGIHSGDLAAAKELINENKMSIPQFEFSDELEETFFVDAWPSYVVISGEGKVLSFRSSFKDIEKLLNKE